MSVVGQTRTWTPVIQMSVSSPGIDIQRPLHHVRSVPGADIHCYSITSSANVSTSGGMVRPIAWAVLRFSKN